MDQTSDRHDTPKRPRPSEVLLLLIKVLRSCCSGGTGACEGEGSAVTCSLSGVIPFFSFWSRVMTKTIGVLALQGAFSEHINVYSKMNKIAAEGGGGGVGSIVNVIQVKTEHDLALCNSLILPGGESTAIALAAKRNGLFDKVVEFIKSGKPVWVGLNGCTYAGADIVMHSLLLYVYRELVLD